MKREFFKGRAAFNVLYLHTVGLPEVPIYGMHKMRRASPGMAMHRHPGMLEICFLAKGERVFHVHGRDYKLRGNDVFWTMSEELHGSGLNADGKGLQYWLHLRLPDKPRRFLALSVQDSWQLVRQLRALPARMFPGSARMKELFETVFLAAANATPPVASTLRLTIAARLVEFLCETIECAQRAGRAPAHSAPIRAALNYLDGRDEPAAISAVAAHVHLSESRFKARFRSEVGIPPGEYILRRRVEHAVHLLRTTRQSVTEIAYALGFSSSQYFATTLRRFTSLTPSQARDAQRAIS